jgi:hypothetical protein
VSGAAAIASAFSTATICSNQPITCELSILTGMLILVAPFVLYDIYKQVTSPDFDEVRSSATGTDGISNVEDQCPKPADNVQGDEG